MAAWVTVLISLPYAGYAWGLAGNRTIAMLAGAVGMLAFAIAQCLAWSVENDVIRLGQHARSDKDEFDQWKQKVDILSGVVGILYRDSVDLKKGMLVGEIDPAAHPRPDEAADGPSQQKLIETDDILALPKFETPGKS